jgi:hypothetical protein
VILSVLAVLALYAGAYCVMLNGRIVPISFERGIELSHEPHYCCGGRISAVFYAPVNLIDKQIRPDKWQKEKPLEINEPISN